MIPGLDPATGNLPPGVYVATWEEIAERFGFTERRRAMLDGLAVALEQLRAVGCQRLYLDGSFVTAKEVPGDYDACWDPAGIDLVRLGLLAPLLFDMDGRRRRQKVVYRGEIFPATMAAGTTAGTILDLFQQDKATGASKGIIVIELGARP
jgi:hypothetical protein